MQSISVVLSLTIANDLKNLAAQSIVPGSPNSCLLRHMSDDKVLRDPAVFNLVLDFYRTGRLHTRKEVQFQ